MKRHSFKLAKSERAFELASNTILKVGDYSHFFFFLTDQNSQHFNEDLLGVNAYAFSFVLCFKATDYAGTSS